MRRTLAVLTLAGVLTAAAACGTQSKPTGAPTAASTSATPSPTPSADYTADTKKVCGDINKVLDGNLKSFSEELGKMVAYKQVKNSAQTDKAKTAAQKELTEMANVIRETTSVAQDPKLKAAGEESATNIATTAASTEFFNKINDPKDLDALKNELTAWLVPLAPFCA